MTCRYADAETGFVYLRARYYDPATGQFISRDPLTAMTGAPYSHVDGNPLNFTDPSGLIAWANLAHRGLKLAAHVGVVAIAGTICVGSAGLGCVVGVGLSVAALHTIGDLTIDAFAENARLKHVQSDGSCLGETDHDARWWAERAAGYAGHNAALDTAYGAVGSVVGRGPLSFLLRGPKL